MIAKVLQKAEARGDKKPGKDWEVGSAEELTVSFLHVRGGTENKKEH